MDEISSDNKGPGRPPHVPTKATIKTVWDCARIGARQEDIAALIEVSIPTLVKHYRETLDRAEATANAAIGGRLYDKAMEGDTASLIWWTKARMRWSERTIVENDVAPGALERLEAMRAVAASRIYAELESTEKA